MKQKIAISLAAILIPTLSVGVYNRAEAGGWGNAVKITGYYAYAASGAYVNTSGNQNLDSCSNNTYLALDTTQPNFKELYATIMTAFATGNTVTLRYNGCTGPYPLIDGVATPAVW